LLNILLYDIAEKQLRIVAHDAHFN